MVMAAAEVAAATSLAILKTCELIKYKAEQGASLSGISSVTKKNLAVPRYRVSSLTQEFRFKETVIFYL